MIIVTFGEDERVMCLKIGDTDKLNFLSVLFYLFKNEEANRS